MGRDTHSLWQWKSYLKPIRVNVDIGEDRISLERNKLLPIGRLNVQPILVSDASLSKAGFIAL